MMSVHTLLEAAQALSPIEQLDLIRALSQSLQRHYQHVLASPGGSDAIPAHVRRTRPVTDLSELVAGFWPVDESADDINTFVAEQRAADVGC